MCNWLFRIIWKQHKIATTKFAKHVLHPNQLIIKFQEVLCNKQPCRELPVSRALLPVVFHIAECGFTCANQKCISLNQTCDGVDDCGDRSDEMCCKSKTKNQETCFIQLKLKKYTCSRLPCISLCFSECRNGAFRCKTGICLHKEAVGDKQIDCLDGADESQKHLTAFSKKPKSSNEQSSLF